MPTVSGTVSTLASLIAANDRYDLQQTNDALSLGPLSFAFTSGQSASQLNILYTERITIVGSGAHGVTLRSLTDYWGSALIIGEVKGIIFILDEASQFMVNRAVVSGWPNFVDHDGDGIVLYGPGTYMFVNQTNQQTVSAGNSIMQINNELGSEASLDLVLLGSIQS